MIKLANTGKQASLLLSAAMFTSVVSAATTITVDSVAQRWPWNNKVDITYTVAEGQDVAAGVYARIVFTASIGATNIVIDGVHDVGANASDGTHTVTWTLPPGLRASDCTMSAQLFSADNPSGDDYMIVDLDTGAITYEGLLASQDASSARYNTSLYKSTNSANKCCMVLRKVPAGGPYPTGDDTHYSGSNSAKEWTTDRAYYIGVFLVTQYQYAKIGADTGATPSTFKQAIDGANVKEERPVDSVSWRDLRLTDTAPTSPIPAVASCEGTFFQRLNYLTGNKFGFDLPTEVMFEIAERAGAKTTYFWGDDMDTRYVVCKDNADTVAGGTIITSPVGSRLSNSWGLFDMAGNIWEWCRDAYTADDLASRTDSFTPVAAVNVNDGRVMRGGGTRATLSTGDDFRASYRTKADPWTHAGYLGGFRVAFVVD